MRNQDVRPSMRQQNNNWLWVLIFLVFALAAGLVNGLNTLQVCKTHDVYWVKGTQYSCKFFK